MIKRLGPVVVVRFALVDRRFIGELLRRDFRCNFRRRAAHHAVVSFTVPPHAKQVPFLEDVAHRLLLATLHR
jgi:hypothetical protein